MAELITRYFQPAELTNISRAIQARQAQGDDPKTKYWFTTDYFTPEFTDDIEYRITPGFNGVPTSAKFRAWDAENPLGVRDGFSTMNGELLPLGQRELFTEKDRLTIRKADPVQYQQALAQAAKRTALATVVRLERAAVNTVLTGKTTLTNERGVTQEADWQRNANRVSTVSVLWTNTSTSTPLKDLLTARELVDTDVDIIMSMPTYNLLRQSQTFLNLAKTNVAGTPDIVTREYVSATLDAYGVGNIRLYDARYRDDTLTEQRILPTGKVIMVTRNAGRTVFGTTAEAMDPKYGIASVGLPGIVTGHYGKEHPKQEWVNTAALAFPVFALPDDSYVLTVS